MLNCEKYPENYLNKLLKEFHEESLKEFKKNFLGKIYETIFARFFKEIHNRPEPTMGIF